MIFGKLSTPKIGAPSTSSTLRSTSYLPIAGCHGKSARQLRSGADGLGYRASTEYGGPITVGTAMAISGAAASPNMGYHSSPAVTLLMTMFNVRLGWWLGNPGEQGDKTYRSLGPNFAIAPLVGEAFGLTTDQSKYVYLSDGGHFENLGLYEMVRRRCRHIVVTDAGRDPHYDFEDLGNAVRKISIDLGVQIRFYGLEKLKKRQNDETSAEVENGPYHAMGEIDYCSADRGGKNGIILYIKVGYHGCESAGVRAYARANQDFPHESTIDQWFTESQFESYRMLGFEITDRILADALADIGSDSAQSLATILEALYQQSLEEIADGQSRRALGATHPHPRTGFAAAAATLPVGETRGSQTMDGGQEGDHSPEGPHAAPVCTDAVRKTGDTRPPAHQRAHPSPREGRSP
jgi:hypothetical protein